MSEVDTESGEVVSMELTPTDLLEYHPVDHRGKLRWVKLKDSPMPPKYIPAIGEVFAYRILNGDGIAAACKEANIDYPLYVKWKKLYPEFRDLVDEARRDRGERFFDKIEETVEETGTDEDEIALARLKVDAYKHLAGVSDPGKYGTKTQVSGTIGVARLVVDTGIRRSEIAGEEKEVFGRIENEQRRIEDREKADVAYTIRKPEGMPMSEREKDGRTDDDFDGVHSKDTPAMDTPKA